MTPVGRVTDNNLVHPEKAFLPIEVTLLGSVTDTNDTQYWKALSPIV